MDTTILLHACTLIPGIGTKTLHELIRQCGSIEAVWSADEKTLLSIKGLGPKTVSALMTGRRALNPVQEWERVCAQGIDILPVTDPRYPALLAETPDAPILLYARGHYRWNEHPTLAIVGSRRFTPYGKQVTERLVADLVRAGFVIVSGLAFGIDAIAHQTALDTGGYTLAVLAGGVNDTSIAPRSHMKLANHIMQTGAILSEYRPGTQPNEGTFPARNRIMAGMCLGTLVIEATEQSGTLITARLALDYNREVFAVPGSIFSPTSIGTHALIRSGAKIVTSVQDILEELPLTRSLLTTNSSAPPLSHTIPGLSDIEQQILQNLSHEPIHVDKIIKAVRLETSSVTVALSLLEIKGCAKDIGGMHYIKTTTAL
ncbi:MAG: DNA-processing protein DprA [Minisyncoccota bacterium]